MTTTATKKLEKKLVVFNMFKAHFENDKTESSFENALAAAGVSRATLMRYKADLKKAGMIIDSHGHALLYAEDELALLQVIQLFAASSTPLSVAAAANVLYENFPYTHNASQTREKRLKSIQIWFYKQLKKERWPDLRLGKTKKIVSRRVSSSKEARTDLEQSLDAFVGFVSGFLKKAKRLVSI